MSTPDDLRSPSSSATGDRFRDDPPGVLFGLSMPMAKAMALRGEAIGGDRARIRMLPQAEQTNSRGDVHGGAIATLLDCALAAAVRAHDPAAFGVATIDLTLHFVASGAGELVGTGHCERRGRSISFARGEVRNEAGDLIAMATGTFKLMPRTSSGGQREG